MNCLLACTPFSRDVCWIVVEYYAYDYKRSEKELGTFERNILELKRATYKLPYILNGTPRQSIFVSEYVSSVCQSCNDRVWTVDRKDSDVYIYGRCIMCSENSISKRKQNV